MVELGKKGFKFNEFTLKLNKEINHTEIYALAQLTRNELTALMFFVDENMLDGVPLEVLSEDEMRTLYLEKRMEISRERKKKEVKEAKSKQDKVQQITNKIMKVLMSI